MPSSVSTSSPRINRKALKRPDEFMQVVTEFFNQLEDHTGAVFAILAVFFVVGLGYAFYKGHAKSTAAKASNLLFVARAELNDQYLAIAKADAPAPKATETKSKDTKAKDAKTQDPQVDPTTAEFKKLDVDATFGDAINKFKNVIDQYSSTRAAFEARLALGDLYYNHGEAAKSLTWYEAAAKSAPTQFEKALALYSLGYGYENSGKLKEAVSAYDRALSENEPSLKGDLLLAKARSYELSKDTKQAKATYEQILSQLPNTDTAHKAELLKAQLQ
jgi:tetratricopeptide (TPR) repeat protein